MKRSKIIAFSIPFLILGGFAVMIALFIRDVNRPPEIGEHIASVDWLPAEATDINYYVSYGFTAYEFKISETGFRAWAATVAYSDRSEHVNYLPVTEVNHLKEKRRSAMERYNLLIGGDGDRPEDFDYSEDLKTTSIEIRNGLRGEVRRGSGGGYSIGYDRDTGTAYWQTNPR